MSSFSVESSTAPYDMFYTEYEISLMPEEPTANTVSAAAGNQRSPSWSLMGQPGAGPTPPSAHQTRPPAKRQGEKRVQRILNSGSLLTCEY